MDDDVTVRRARHDDYEAVAAFTRDTWADRGAGAEDYIPRIYHDWIDGDGGDQRTFLLEADGTVAAVLQAVTLSPYEAWMQGIRVHPDYRGRGLATRIQSRAFEWARERGATVARNMVFSWNAAGLGVSRDAGYDPCAEFRWARPAPAPDPDADADADLDVVADADAAWAFWGASDARDRLRGLALDAEESWAVSELTRERLLAAADDGRLAVVRAGGVRGFTLRNRTYDREGGGEEETWAEYAVGAWADADAARALLRWVARDAAAVGADRTRVLIPESVEHVSDVAAARVEISEEPDFVLAADLTDPAVGGDETRN